MTYRIFRRTWWLDTACTMPGPGRKYYSGQTAATEEEARQTIPRISDRLEAADHAAPHGSLNHE